MSGQGADVANIDVAWVNGMDVYATMTPAFRDNLGDPDRVEWLFSRYWQRNLFLDEHTGARIDHIRVEAGYEDLSSAYHDSVEECYVLGGDIRIPGEGDFRPGDYFWRPPGFVHKAYTEGGFEALLMMQGEDATERSRYTSRVIRPDDEAGTNATLPFDDAIGPRGWVRQLTTTLLPWADAGDVLGVSLPGEARLLSRNVTTGSCTALVRLPAGTRASFPADTITVVAIDGDVSVNENAFHAELPGLVRVNRSVEIFTEGGCFAFVKLARGATV